MPPRFLALTLALLALATPAAHAQDKPATELAVVTRVYPVADLLGTRVPNYANVPPLVPPTDVRNAPDPAAVADPRGGILGVPPGDAPAGIICFPPPPGMPTDPADDLIQLIQSIVARDTWTENGGIIGSIKLLSTQLVVTQTEGNQQQVADLLAALRKGSATNVRVEAAWPALAAADLDAAERGGALDRLVAALDPATPRGRITCLNGQVVHLAAGPAVTVVTGLAPTTNPAAVAPTTAAVQAGAFLELNPLLISEPHGPATRAILSLRSVLSRFDAPPTPIPSATTRPAALSIDRLSMSVAHLATTVTLPLGQWTVIGGLTPDATAAQRDGTQVYLLVRVTAPTE